MKLTTAQIGKCGELLVQFLLLKMGIESSAMTTDSGIDLVGYSQNLGDAFTIQVKTNLKPKPGGGKGRLSINWRIPKDCPSDFAAFVDLETSRVWLMSMDEVKQLAQQQPENTLHFFMVVDPDAPKRRDGKLLHDYEFQRHLLDNAVPRLLKQQA